MPSCAVSEDASESGVGLAPGSLALLLEAVRDFSRERLSDDVVLAADAAEELPEGLLEAMHGGVLGLGLLSLPRSHGGPGAGALDLCRVAEALAAIDLAVATALLATQLGTDLLAHAGTTEQRQLWLGRIAEQSLMTAFCASEPGAGSDLAAIASRAERVEEGGHPTAYRLRGEKQWISNAGIADLYLVLARAPGGTSWFVVEEGAPGLGFGPPEAKHGLRASRTSSVFLDDVTVDSDRLVGDGEGRAAEQTVAVLARGRLLAAACGLGAGWAALLRALRYSRSRFVGAAPVASLASFTHKLIVAPAVLLEASRAVVEEAASSLDLGADRLPTEGALAKLLATEAGNFAADCALQAHGANGYSRDCGVEKIRRDVRATTIYEGTSEVLEDSVARGRWKSHLRSEGRHYLAVAEELDRLHSRHREVGADLAALAARSLAAVLEEARRRRLNRHRYLWHRLGEAIARTESSAALARRAALAAAGKPPGKRSARLSDVALAAAARIHARQVAMTVAVGGRSWLASGEVTQAALLNEILRGQEGLIEDLDLLARRLYDELVG